MILLRKPSDSRIRRFLDEQRSLPFSYPEVGASREGAPPGYPVNHHRGRLGVGPEALQLRLFQTMGEIAVNQNSTIILPIPLDLFRPFLESQNGSYGQGVEAARREEEKEAEREAEQLYKEAVGDAASEVSSEAVPTEMPDGEAKR